MDIYLEDKSNRKSKFVFPALPEKIEVKTGTNYQDYKIIGLGSVKIPKGSESASVSWNGEFFGYAKRKEAIVRANSWAQPRDCVKILENWRKKGKILVLKVTDTSINMDVTIGDFSYTEYGAFGNIQYNISFQEYRTLKIYTTKEKKIKKSIGKLKSRSSKEKKKKVKIAIGESLHSIALKELGTGREWKRIYDANKDELELCAIRNKFPGSDMGKIIFPGTVIKIPR